MTGANCSFILCVMLAFAVPAWAEAPAAPYEVTPDQNLFPAAEERVGEALPAEPQAESPPSETLSPAASGPARSFAPAGNSPSPLTGTPAVINDAALVDVLEFKDMDIMDALKVLAEKSGLNIIAGRGISGRVTIYLKNVKLKDVLRIILDANGLAYSVEDGVVRVMPAKDFELRYGYVFGGDIRTKIVRLMYAEVPDLVTLLNQIKSPAGKIIFEIKSNTLVLMDAPGQLQMMEDLINEIDAPVTTRVFELSYAKAKDISEKIEGEISKTGGVRFDERSNKLIVTDTPQKIERVAQVVAAFDMKREQVLIEAKIVQIILSDQTKFGVDWEAIVRQYNDLDIKSKFDILNRGDKGGTMSIGTLSDDNYTVLLQALASSGLTNILSSPSITAIDGQEAKILVGSTEPYVTTTTTTPSSGPTTTAESVNFIDVGVKLYVTPQIHKDRFITMKIKPEVSSMTRTLTTGNNNSIPVVETSEAETTVTVKDGVTIVIGGLIKEEKITMKNKVPFLGDIPLVGHAFRNSDDLKRKTEIVVFLTPRIITGDVQVEKPISKP